ncbi:MAG TPA: FlgD immunoglobulin-like domain containing protein [Candidatus Krumholzibacteria bacterium]|nr:FlgD immunoglobulin-like domain containing protein [Candidatus Krumholzibacteria bacterium]
MFPKNFALRTIAVLALALLTVLPQAASAAGKRLFMLHHSTGRYILEYGGARARLDAVNTVLGTDHRLWDHDYNYIGLSDADGSKQGYDFGVPDDNTDPEGLHTLWTTANAARDSILSRFDVIAFKSCYEPTNFIYTDAQLEQYKTWYLEIRDVLDQHPDKTFLIMTPPPLLPELTDTVKADRARAYAKWLGSDEFLAGHPNLRFFDLFDLLATPDDGSATRNTLRPEYTRDSGVIDNHPNDLACQTIAPLLVDALVAAAEGGVAAAPDALPAVRVLGNRPNPFNPSTAILLAVDEPTEVQVQVFDLRGRLVRTLVDAPLAAGPHAVRWDGRTADGQAAASGVYLYRVHAGTTALSGRMTLAK